MMGFFCILIIVVIRQTYTCTKTHRLVHQSQRIFDAYTLILDITQKKGMNGHKQREK